MKKLIWTAMATIASAAAAAVAFRVLRAAWRFAYHEEPPETPWWARKLVKGPLKSRVHDSITAGDVTAR